MNYFFDTSAIIKLYFSEKGSKPVRNIFKNKQNFISISFLSRFETISTLNKFKNNNSISDKDLHKSKHRFLTDIGTYIYVIECQCHDKELIDEIIISENLTSSDALILAQCCYLKKQINANLIFVSSDKDSNLLKAAVNLGLETFDPRK